MWDLPDLGRLSDIGPFEDANHASPFEHGLGRPSDGHRLAIMNARSSVSSHFGITQMLPVSLESGAPEEAIASAIQLLQHHVSSWRERVSYHELGASFQLLPDETSDADADNETTGSKSADKRFVLHPYHYGYIRLNQVFSRVFGHIRAENPDEPTLHATELAERALKELLPEQAYLFISPDALMIATKEAERIAEETIKHAKQRDKESPKESKVYGQVKQKLEHGIRALRHRHDGRMHIFPYTQLSAPDTGVATIAIIASQQQSIVGDHGRYSASARGLVF